MIHQAFKIDLYSKFRVAGEQPDAGKEFPAWLLDDLNGFALFQLNSAGQVIQWNKGARRLTGFAAQEMIGQHYACLYALKETFHDTPHYELIIAAQKGSFEKEMWWLRRDGSRVWVRVIFMGIDHPGTQDGFAVMVWNLSKDLPAETAKFHGSSALDE